MTDEELQEELKSYLNITWSEKDGDLLKIIKRGKTYLNGKAGTTLVFNENDVHTQLLLDYGRYVYNHTFELFEINFKRELLSLSIREAVKAHAATNTEATT